MQLIDLTLSLDNINFITILSLFIPGYFILLLSGYQLKRINKAPYLSSKMDKWEIILWYGIYSILCYMSILLIVNLFSFLKIDWISLENNYFLFTIYLFSILCFSSLDYSLRKRLNKNRTGKYNLLEEMDEYYKEEQNKSYVWIKLKNGESYRGLFLGVDYSNIDKKLLKIGKSSKTSIRRKFKKETKDLESNTAFFNLDEIVSLFFKK